MSIAPTVRLANLALVVVLAACPRAQEPALVADFNVTICPAPRLSHCTVRDCGGNSPIINRFPINGFAKAAHGACNRSGVQLVPYSLEGGACGHGADLGLDATASRLVGRYQGTVVCTGEQLTGASFVVRSFTSSTLMFTIAGVRQIALPDGRTHEGYRIT